MNINKQSAQHQQTGTELVLTILLYLSTLSPEFGKLIDIVSLKVNEVWDEVSWGEIYFIN